MIHNCNNDVCELLNPSLTELLKYDDLLNRITKIQQSFFDILKNPEKLCKHPFDFFSWCTFHHVFQMANFEFVDELSKKIKEIDPETVLEIGAGRGIISNHIMNILDREIILTDDHSTWEDNEDGQKIENPKVIKMDYKKAINTFKPDLIIACWIPYQKCWTKYFRLSPSVKGYILIGEGRGGCTGCDQDWYASWIKHRLDEVEKYGIARSDAFNLPSKYSYTHTNVTYFERP